MSNVEGLGGKISVSIPADEEGYIGRECPQPRCLGYFKVMPGTGLSGTDSCLCPYCGHKGAPGTFFTPEQIEYARSVAIGQILDAVHQDLKGLEFNHPPRGAFGIGLSLKVRAGDPHPISHYRERDLETAITCDDCTLKYTIYGVFGWCSDCGSHNSRQILTKNLELARKQAALAQSVDADLAEHLINDALENVVSAFDGFGREVCVRKGFNISFQNIGGARRRVQEAFDFDLAAGLNGDAWDQICRVFQKRHLLAHKMGVVDSDYLQKAKDPDAVVGRKVRVTIAEVAAAIDTIEAMGQNLYDGLFGKPDKPTSDQS